MIEHLEDPPTKFSVNDFLEWNSRASLNHQREDGSFPPANNGIYDEPETPVRTTAKWLIALSHTYDRTKRSEYCEAANKAADYLLSNEARPHDYTFQSRRTDNKNKCDGLVGQSSPIRALAEAGTLLGRPELINEAEEVFRIHPFNRDVGLWEQIEINGKNLSFDRTLNHQISFASAGSFLASNSTEIKNQVEHFLNSLTTNLRTRDNGVIRHFVRPDISTVLKCVFNSPNNYNILWNEFVDYYHRYSKKQYVKEVGYHTVNLDHLSTLKSKYTNHKLWQLPKIQHAVEYALQNQYKESKDNQSTPYGTMLPKITIAHIQQEFIGDSVDIISNLLAEGISQNFDFDKGLLTKNAIDPKFQSSQIYKLTEFDNYEVQINKPADT